MKDLLVYSSVLLLGVFIAAVSQVMLKKEAMKEHSSASKEYLNPLVIFAYVLFVGTTFLSIIAYKVVPLSMGPVLESTSYLWITLFGVIIFREKITKRRLLALVLIVTGTIIFSLSASV